MDSVLTMGLVSGVIILVIVLSKYGGTGVAIVACFLAVASIIVYTASKIDYDAGSRQALVDQGYTNIQMTGMGFFGCPKEDAFNRTYIATTPAGHTVKGRVCSDFFGNYQIKLSIQ